MNTLQTINGIAWIHLEYLESRSLPLVVYLTNPRSQAGAVIPFLISLALSLKYLRRIQDQKIILGFLLFAIAMGLFTQYWGITGLHLFTGGFVIWPILVLLLGDRFPWPLAYPLTFIGILIPDLYGAGMANDWSRGWFFGVGGAGFHDGLFLMPLETLIAAALLNQMGIYLRKRGYFSRRASVDEDVYPEGKDRRAR